MHRTLFITNIKTPNFKLVKTSLSALLGATALLSLGLSTPVNGYVTPKGINAVPSQ